MKKQRLILAFLALPLGAFASAYALQHGGNVCECDQDATYHDNPGTSWPACVQNFGVSFTSTQSGRCAVPPCSPRPCQGDITVSGTGGCSWRIRIDYPDGVYEDLPFPTSFTGTTQYSIGCASQWTIQWTANGVSLGTHVFRCKNCQGGIGD